MITITTDLDCQGIIEREVFISEDILYYPNPTKGEVDVYIHGKDESVRMTVYSLKGDLIFTRKQTIRSTRKTDLDLVGVPAGTPTKSRSVFLVDLIVCFLVKIKSPFKL